MHARRRVYMNTASLWLFRVDGITKQPAADKASMSSTGIAITLYNASYCCFSRARNLHIGHALCPLHLRYNQQVI